MQAGLVWRGEHGRSDLVQLVLGRRPAQEQAQNLPVAVALLAQRVRELLLEPHRVPALEHQEQDSALVLNMYIRNILNQCQSFSARETNILRVGQLVLIAESDLAAAKTIDSQRRTC